MDASEKIYLTFTFGDDIRSVVPLEDPREKGFVVYRQGACVFTSTGQVEGVDWHSTFEGARARHVHNIQQRIDTCLADLKKLTGLLTDLSTSAKRTSPRG